MEKCPTCNGSGRVWLTVSHWGSDKKDKIPVKCVDCGGEGQVSAVKLARMEEEKNMWCKCKKPSGEYYVPDGVDPKCKKHHWKCGVCSKIIQIG